MDRNILLRLIHPAGVHCINRHLSHYVSREKCSKWSFVERSINVLSLNDSFAHVKRELAALNQQHEMMVFMWSTFRKIAGMNNNDHAKARTTMISEKPRSDAPLAAIDDEEF